MNRKLCTLQGSSDDLSGRILAILVNAEVRGDALVWEFDDAEWFHGSDVRPAWPGNGARWRLELRIHVPRVASDRLPAPEMVLEIADMNQGKRRMVSFGSELRVAQFEDMVQVVESDERAGN